MMPIVTTTISHDSGERRKGSHQRGRWEGVDDCGGSMVDEELRGWQFESFQVRTSWTIYKYDRYEARATGSCTGVFNWDWNGVKVGADDQGVGGCGVEY